MSRTATADLADRILDFDWSGPFKHTTSRVSLMCEFLRRSALWAEKLDSRGWPFFDVAAEVDSSVRADPELVREVSNALDLQHPLVVQTCAWALHFAELSEKGDVEFDLPDPFEPLVLMYQRGGGFALEGTGFVEVDGVGIPIRSRDERTADNPLDLDAEHLDTLDG